MQPSFFAASFLLLLLFSFCFLSPSAFAPFTLPSFSYLVFALLSLFFRSLFASFLPPFTPLSVVVPCRTPPLFIRSSFFSSAPYSYMGGYEAKVRKIDRKVTFFLSKTFICYVYIAKLCGNVLQNIPTFANSISLCDFLF